MAEFTGDKKYTDSLKKFCDNAVSGQTRSPGGMLHYAEWGSLRYASNAAFICLQVKRIFCYCNLFFFIYMIMIKYNVEHFQAADLVDGESKTYTDLAQGQMDYILGGNPKGQR